MISLRDLWEFLVLPFAGYLGLRWLERRVTESARGAVDVAVGKALADYKHPLDAQLEDIKQSLSLVRERYSRDYALFAERRNVAYAEIYSLMEVAHGGFAPHFQLIRSSIVYDESPEADLRHVAARLELVSEDNRKRLNDLIDAKEIKAAGRLATQLVQHEKLRRANQASNDFRNASILNSLYCTDAIEELLGQARQALGLLEIYAEEILDGEPPIDQRTAHAKIGEVKVLVLRVRNAMRAEMRAGFSPGVAQPKIEAATPT